MAQKKLVVDGVVQTVKDEVSAGGGHQCYTEVFVLRTNKKKQENLADLIEMAGLSFSKVRITVEELK